MDDLKTIVQSICVSKGIKLFESSNFLTRIADKLVSAWPHQSKTVATMQINDELKKVMYISKQGALGMVMVGNPRRNIMQQLSLSVSPEDVKYALQDFHRFD